MTLGNMRELGAFELLISAICGRLRASATLRAAWHN